MAPLRRKAALAHNPQAAPSGPAAPPASPAGKRKAGSHAKPNGGAAADTAGGGGALAGLPLPLRAALALAALLAAAASAWIEWDIYCAYEKDWRQPASLFARDLTLSAAIAVAVGVSPPARALKRTGQVAAAVSATSAGRPASKQSRRQVVAGVVLLLMALSFGFGFWGPNGSVTAAALTAFVFLAVP